MYRQSKKFKKIICYLLIIMWVSVPSGFARVNDLDYLEQDQERGESNNFDNTESMTVLDSGTDAGQNTANFNTGQEEVNAVASGFRESGQTDVQITESLQNLGYNDFQIEVALAQPATTETIPEENSQKNQSATAALSPQEKIKSLKDAGYSEEKVNEIAVEDFIGQGYSVTEILNIFGKDKTEAIVPLLLDACSSTDDASFSADDIGSALKQSGYSSSEIVSLFGSNQESMDAVYSVLKNVYKLKPSEIVPIMINNCDQCKGQVYAAATKSLLNDGYTEAKIIKIFGIKNIDSFAAGMSAGGADIEAIGQVLKDQGYTAEKTAKVLGKAAGAEENYNMLINVYGVTESEAVSFLVKYQNGSSESAIYKIAVKDLKDQGLNDAQIYTELAGVDFSGVEPVGADQIMTVVAENVSKSNKSETIKTKAGLVTAALLKLDSNADVNTLAITLKSAGYEAKDVATMFKSGDVKTDKAYTALKNTYNLYEVETVSILVDAEFSERYSVGAAVEDLQAQGKGLTDIYMMLGGAEVEKSDFSDTYEFIKETSKDTDKRIERAGFITVGLAGSDDYNMDLVGTTLKSLGYSAKETAQVMKKGWARATQCYDVLINSYDMYEIEAADTMVDAGFSEKGAYTSAVSDLKNQGLSNEAIYKELGAVEVDKNDFSQTYEWIKKTSKDADKRKERAKAITYGLKKEEVKVEDLAKTLKTSGFDETAVSEIFYGSNVSTEDCYNVLTSPKIDQGIYNFSPIKAITLMGDAGYNMTTACNLAINDKFALAFDANGNWKNDNYSSINLNNIFKELGAVSKDNDLNISLDSDWEVIKKTSENADKRIERAGIITAILTGKGVSAEEIGATLKASGYEAKDVAKVFKAASKGAGEAYKAIANNYDLTSSSIIKNLTDAEYEETAVYKGLMQTLKLDGATDSQICESLCQAKVSDFYTQHQFFDYINSSLATPEDKQAYQTLIKEKGLENKTEAEIYEVFKDLNMKDVLPGRAAVESCDASIESVVKANVGLVVPALLSTGSSVPSVNYELEQLGFDRSTRMSLLYDAGVSLTDMYDLI